MPMTLRTRIRDERGAALITALLATMLLTALGMAAVLVSNTEGMITANYRRSSEAIYAADAAVEMAVQDLLMVPRWNDVISGGTAGNADVSSMTASFVFGDARGAEFNIPAGGTVILCCSATSVSGQLQAESNTANLWGTNNPTWRLYAWGPLSSVLPTQTVDSDAFVAVWVADDPSETDGNPMVDGNGVLTLHAEAYGGGGTRKIIEVTVSRTSSTEIERGQIAQRGQEELNQRARKAAVQQTGKALTEMRMNTGTGGLGVVP
jgi:type IV pilus assembly PilX-like protein